MIDTHLAIALAEVVQIECEGKLPPSEPVLFCPGMLRGEGSRVSFQCFRDSAKRTKGDGEVSKRSRIGDEGTRPKQGAC